MLEDVVNSLITRFLGEYIKDIDKNDLKVSIWKGDVKLRNLEVKTEALDFLDLPVEIKSGYIGELTLSVPWKEIGRKPTKVMINQIFVVVCPRSEVHYDEEAFTLRALELKRQRLKAIDEKETKRMKELNEKEDKSLISSLVSKIIRNFEMSIDEIHIRYEDHSSDLKHPFCGGISLEQISVSPNHQISKNSDEESTSAKQAQHNGVFMKNVLIHRFGIYWDSDNRISVDTTNVESLTEDMELAFHKPLHAENRPVPLNYILHPLSIDINVNMDIRGVELRKPTPEEAAKRAMEELGWNKEVLVNQNLIETYIRIKRDDIRGRDEAEETALFIKKFKKKFPKFCSSLNLQYATTFASICWKYANVASPVIVASAKLPQVTVTVLQSQIRDVTILLDNLTLQVRRAQQPVNRPEKNIMKHPRSWWRYAIRCVIKSNSKKRAAVAWEDYLKFKQQRNEYIDLYKHVLKAPGYPSIQKNKAALKRKAELEDVFSIENTILFRKMAQLEIDKDGMDQDSSEGSEESDEELRTELYKELEISAEDVNPWEGGQPLDIIVSVDFQLESAQIMLKKEEQKYVDIGVNGIRVRAFKRKEFLEIWAMVSDLKVLDSLTPKTRYSHLISVRHDNEGSVMTPQDSPLPNTESEMESKTDYSLLPGDLLSTGHKPFIQAHIEVPALDNSSGMRVEARMETLDVVVNVPWVLEMLRFVQPENLVIMSRYVEKAYNMVTALREGDSTFLAAVQNNRGMTLDIRLSPINIIIPDSCIAHRSKTQLLLAQIGEVIVTAAPKISQLDPEHLKDEDLYNTIDVKVCRIALGFMDGRSFANRSVVPLAVLTDIPFNTLIVPFDVNVSLQMCLVNEMRYVSTKVGVTVMPLTINITKSLLDAALNWTFPILDVFLSKQRELDLNVMDLLLKPKQLLLSCIAFDGSPLLRDHNITNWKTTGSKQQKLLYRLVMHTQEQMQLNHPLNQSQQSSSSFSNMNSITVSNSHDEAYEPSYGVMHLTYEDLLLLQYKPMMMIDVNVQSFAITVHDPESTDKLILAIRLNQLAMHYSDHFYDMDIALTIPELLVEDYVRQEQLVSYGTQAESVPMLLEASPRVGGDFLQLRFLSVGVLSMLNDYYDAASNIFASLGPIAINLNAAIVNRLIPLIPSLPSKKDNAESQPKEDIVPVRVAQRHEGLMFLHMTMKSLQVTMLEDDGSALMELALRDLQTVFNQTRTAVHLLLCLQDVSLTDCTKGCGLYPSVLAIQHTEKKASFLSADVTLVNSDQYSDLADTTVDVHMSAPILTIRYRFIQELIRYTQTGTLGRLLHSPLKPGSAGQSVSVSSGPSGQSGQSGQSESSLLTSTANLHAFLVHSVDNLFAGLVGSNIIRRVVSSTNVTSYVLPRANVSLQNLVVIIPAGSESQETLQFELGMFTIGNASKLTEEEERGALFMKESNELTTNLSMRIEGMHLLSNYQLGEAIVSQSILGRVDVSVCVLLHSALYTSIHITPLVVTLNQTQLSFLLTRLLNNLNEEAITSSELIVNVSDHSDQSIPVNNVVSEIHDQIEVSVEQSESTMELNTTNEPSFWIGDAFYTDIILDGVLIEVLNHDGGYTNDSSGQSLVKSCGSDPNSFFLLCLDALSLNASLTTRQAALNVSLASIKLKDTRNESTVLPLFREPLQFGDDKNPALTMICQTSEGPQPMVDVLVCLHSLRLFPAPLFLDILSFLPSFLNSVPKKESTPTKIEGVSDSASPMSVSPSIRSLLSLLRVQLQIDPLTVFFASSFTRPSPLVLLNIALDSTLAITEAFDLSFAIVLRDMRIAQCTMDQLQPPHDCNDILQSWSLAIQVDMKDSFKTVSATMKDSQGLHMAIGYKDVEILMNWMNALLAKVSTSTTNQPLLKEESSIFPVVKLPLIVSEDSAPLNITATVSLHSIQVVVVSDVSNVEVPFIQLELNTIEATCDFSTQLVFVIQFKLQADFYNQPHIAWEPLIEPWEMLLQVIQHRIPSEVVQETLSQGASPPPQSSCTIRAEKVMNVNISAAFCGAALQFLNRLQKYRGETESDHSMMTENGYYLYVENCLGVEATLNIIYDGGLGMQLEKIRSQWECIEHKQKTLRCSGPLYVCCSEADVRMCYVEVFTDEPCVRASTPIGQSLVTCFTSRSGSLKIHPEGLILFTCIDTNTSSELSFFSSVSAEQQRWRQALLQPCLSLESSSNDEETLLIASGARIRSSLPAHPNISVIQSIESYNQRIVAIGVQGCHKIQFCCDREGETPFTVSSNDNTVHYDILVRVLNTSGLRIIQLVPLIEFHQYCHYPLYCRFMKEDSESAQNTIYQSQRKQINLEDVKNNYFGVPVGLKHPSFDTQTPNYAIRHPSVHAEWSFLALGFEEAIYCPVTMGLKGRFELLGSGEAKSVDSCIHHSISVPDITSLKLRRLCLNVGSLEKPHYVLLRVNHSQLSSDSHANPAFSIITVPVMVLKNLLPMPIEFRVLNRRNTGNSIVQSGTVESGKSIEITAVDGCASEFYSILVRPMNSQFVWGRQVIPIATEGRGECELTDLENSQTCIHYQYSYQKQGEMESSETLLLSVFCPYWVINRTNETLFLAGKNDTSVVRLPSADIAVNFASVQLDPTTTPLQPLLFNTGSKKAVVRLRKGNSSWSPRVSLGKQNNACVCIPASAPFTLTDSLYSVSVKRLQEPFAATQLIMISPQYVFVNKTAMDLWIQQQDQSFSLPASSCICRTEFLPSSRRLLTIKRDASDSCTAEFDCDGSERMDLVLPGEQEHLLSVTTSRIEEMQAVTIDVLKPEDISYCISNNSTLDRISVLQSACDLSTALMVPPMDSHMWILPNPVGVKQAVIFLHQITEPETELTFQPFILVDLSKAGVVTTVTRKNPDRVVEIVVEIEDTTKIVIIRDKLPEADLLTTAWEQKKHLAFMSSVLEESLSTNTFAFNDIDKETNDFVVALQDFEDHASQSTDMDLLINDDYYWVYLRNISVRNLQRRPCSITVRVSNGEVLYSTDNIKGSHVFLGKEVILKRRSEALQIKVLVSFEKIMMEFDVAVAYASHAEFNHMELLQIPFNSTTGSVSREGDAMCTGGSLYLFMTHCHNNVLTNNQQDYLPRLLRTRFDLAKKLQELNQAKRNLEYEQRVVGLSLQARDQVSRMMVGQNAEQEALTTHVGNHHIERALHRGDYANAPSMETISQKTAGSEEAHEVKEDEMESQIEELEREKFFTVELRKLHNVPTGQSESELQVWLRVNGQSLSLGRQKAVKQAVEYSAQPLEVVFSQTRLGCKFCVQDDGHIVVNRVVNESEAAKHGVCVGMTLWGLNGKMIQGADESINQQLKRLPRPLKITFMAPYRMPTCTYQDILWTGQVMVPSELTLGQKSVQLEVCRGDSVVFTQALKIHRFSDWEGSIGDSQSPLTSCDVLTHWLDRSAAVTQTDTLITVSLGGIDVSILDAIPREIVNAGIRGIAVNLTTMTNDRQSFDITITTVQVDNQLMNAMEPVLLGRVRPDSPLTLKINAIIPSHPSIGFLEYLRIQLSDIFVAMDNRLLVALIQLLGDIPLELLGTSSTASILDMSEFQPIIRIPVDRQSSLRVFAEKFVIEDTSVVISNRIDPATTTTGIFLPSIPMLLPIQTLLDTLCGLVADIDRTTLRFAGIRITNFFGFTSELGKRIILHYVSQGSRQVLKLVGSMNLIGNPVGLVEDVSSGVKAFIETSVKDDSIDKSEYEKRVEEGGKVLMRKTARGFFNSASKITGTLGNGLASLTFNKHYKEQRVMGRSGLLHGLTSGVTGVVMDPIRGAKKNGVRGALEGVGMGLAGVVTKPISGLMDDTTRLLDTAKAAAGDDEKYERLRLPRCVLCDYVIRAYDEHTAQGQMLYAIVTTRFLVEQEEDEQYVLHCCVDVNSHYFLVTQYHAFLLEPNCDLLWCIPLQSISVEVDDEEMRILQGTQSRLVLFSDKEICSRLYGIIINIPSWTSKEIVQCSKDFVNFVTSRHLKETEIEKAYTRPAVDFKSLDILSVCLLSVDLRYERKMAGNYSVKANSYQEYCLEIVGGVEKVAMASWRVYRRYSELRSLYKAIEGRLPKELKNVKFPGKKMQILGSHLSAKALDEREQLMRVFIDEVLSKEVVMQLEEVKSFLCTSPVNIRYEV